MVKPNNFGLSNRSGTDALVHLLQLLSDSDPDLVITSIDGVGAFDHIARARIFEQLLANTELNDFVPFVKLWYDAPTLYKWEDDNGKTHDILQGDGGEQGDALMPALFCLALKPALDRIRLLLPPGCYVFAYLDDIYVIAPADDTRRCYDIVSECLKEMSAST